MTQDVTVVQRILQLIQDDRHRRRYSYDDASTWDDKAACKTHDGEYLKWFFSQRVDEIIKAKRICATCPIRQECYERAVQRKEPWGIWGGAKFDNGVVVASDIPLADIVDVSQPYQPLTERVTRRQYVRRGSDDGQVPKKTTGTVRLHLAEVSGKEKTEGKVRTSKAVHPDEGEQQQQTSA